MLNKVGKCSQNHNGGSKPALPVKLGHGSMRKDASLHDQEASPNSCFEV